MLTVVVLATSGRPFNFTVRSALPAPIIVEEEEDEPPPSE
jgi:hypothetical protein